MKAIFLRAAIALWVCCRLTGLPVNAQSWPTLPITMIITFGGGGGGDTIAWLFAKFASEHLGQPFVVENRPGAGGVMAAMAVANAPPDGYTISLQTIGSISLRPLMDPPVGYDPVKGFSPLGLVAESPNVVVIGSKFSALSNNEMVVRFGKSAG